MLIFLPNEAQSAELVQAILLSYLFSCILLNLSAFPISFLPIGGSIQKHNFFFYFFIIFLFFFIYFIFLFFFLLFYISFLFSFFFVFIFFFFFYFFFIF